jgi:hypothetical protein
MHIHIYTYALSDTVVGYAHVVVMRDQIELQG